MNVFIRAQRGLCVAAGLTSAIMLVAACASMPPAPTASIDAAKLAIANADKADASHYAGAELTKAREQLASADSAVTAKNMVQAQQLADQSRVEAEYATAKTEALKAVAVNNEMLRGADALTEEMQRAGEQR